MKFSCLSTELAKGISIVEKAISNRTPMAVLENISMKTSGSQLVLRGNNLEVGIEYKVPLIKEETAGDVLIKAQTISHVVSKMSGEHEVDISVDDKQKILIHSNKVDFDLLGRESSEYPEFPSFTDAVQFTIPIKTLKSLIQHTIFSVSTDEGKPFLNGVLMAVDGSQMTMVATDGFRLSLDKVPFSEVAEPFEVIVPSKAMSELNRIFPLLGDEESVSIQLGEKQISFSCQNFLLVSRIIQGKFPDYRHVLPDTSEYTEYRLSKRTLLSACERADVIAHHSNQTVRLSFQDQEVLVTAKSAKMGEFQESIPVVSAANAGSPLRISYNIRLLTDAIKHIESDDLSICFNNAFGPCVFRPVSSDAYVYVVMPIRVTEFDDEASSEPVATASAGA